MNISRRGFIFGGAAFAIVSPKIIMPIKPFEELQPYQTVIFDSLTKYSDEVYEKILRHALAYQAGPETLRRLNAYRIRNPLQATTLS